MAETLREWTAKDDDEEEDAKSLEGVDEKDKYELVLPKANMLIPPKPLAEICGTEKFHIISYYPDRFNAFDIISENGKDVELFRLREDMIDVLEYLDCTLNRAPEVQDVVLAPTETSTYHRAIVLKVISAKKVLVYHIDTGGKLIVDTDSLKMITTGLMKVPILAHHVVLQDMPPNSDWILSSKFSKRMAKLVKHGYTIEIGDANPNKGFFSSPHKIIMSYEVDRRKKMLVDEINSLKVWEWEKYSNLVGTDVELCEKGKYGNRIRTSCEGVPMLDFPLDVGAKFKALVSRVVQDALDPTVANLHITHLDNPTYVNYYNVLHNQLQRLTEHLEPSSFYPANMEAMMFKIVTTKETNFKYRKMVKEVDKWVRALRLETAIYLIDLDDMVPYTELPDSDFRFRQIYGEFFLVPVLNLKIRVKENGKFITVQEAQEKFVDEGRTFLKFTITNKCPQIPGIYEAEFERV